MSLLLDVSVILILFSLFAISHSILASSKIKRNLVESIGEKIAFYRLFYNLSSLLIFLFIYELSPKPDYLIYDLKFPFDIIIFVLQIIAAIGFLWAVSLINVREFLGISQIQRYLKHEYKIAEMDEHMELVIRGPFKYSRHPIYLFSILFLGLRPTMDLFYFIFYLVIVLYFIIGSYFEERKLVERFGQIYIDYQKEVPRIIPIKFRNRV